MLRFITTALIFLLTSLSLLSCTSLIGEKEDFVFSDNTVKVFFVQVKNKFSTEVKPVPRELKGDVNKLKQSLIYLLEGVSPEESKKGYGSEIPEGTRLLAVNETPEQISIDLSGQFTAGGGSRSMILRSKQLEETILNLVEKKPVYILVEGKQLKVLGGEGLVVDNPLNEPESQSVE